MKKVAPFGRQGSQDLAAEGVGGEGRARQTAAAAIDSQRPQWLLAGGVASAGSPEL